MHLTRSLLVLLLASALGCTRERFPAAAVARQVVGCYELAQGPWDREPALAGDVSTASAPKRFRLTDLKFVGWDELQSDSLPLYRVDIFGEPWPRYWRQTRTDRRTIGIGTPLMLAGVTLTLTPSGEDLEGVVTASTDAISEGQRSEASRPVRAIRIPCSQADSNAGRPG